MPTSPTPVTYLFVYGTLLNASEKPMAQYLRQHSQLIGAGRFPGRLYDLGEYPGAVYDRNADGLVHGELYTFSEVAVAGLLNVLDEYEGDEYRRAVVPVQTGNGLIDCWTYLLIQPTAAWPVIASGRYTG
ncbi:gamma-glutamylcyclotransferase (GGCT)/AIG2-like uncharacterized protein YtfP [Larkinella arboricola]|uniref:Gamma-glutamylcyclotransferase (GGCT)/AIG2-like uncharacterized protein YtfP n=1 Tax=Larkinella arboricola TaxID=643671 RepID=A0A327X1P8_LARAB|nr:gamma-glutamylcyclotransferase family protein [Larkinella arboricola]RAJ98224.1 gamma-glutamylcyclotransferase (GGCT)/AIG2-like uncharacterized protein YtfP [Larkinella arboricola]